MYRGKRPSRDELEEMGKTMSQREIAKKIGVHYNTASNWFGQYGLSRKYASAEQNHVLLSEEAIEFLDGDMLGDGSVERFGSSGRVCLSSKYREYATWYGERLSEFGIEQSGVIAERKSSSVIGDRKIISTGYRYKSRKYFELKQYSDRFYPGGAEKGVPRDIRITPLSLKMWYVGDGTLAPFSKSSQIVLCTDAFSKEDIFFLIDKLQDIGFSARYYACRNRIRINSSSVQDFLDYIGKPTGIIEQCYGYKWKPVLNLNKNGKIRNNSAKLLDSAVREIRKSTLSQSKLSKIYGIGGSTIGRIKRNEAYTDVSSFINNTIRERG